ncbi:DEAD/DEAH box helicase [Candidatus Aalborgicola defluviihabitans]|uniref:DEAD/DEAH box helicase n=1 Tax=Candidatus Aalborgicola defluviihabitans TaxID=3386187 RepID=UPI001D2A9F54|nr:DEAD/DEAH box helicase [Burkholderiales bacterium]MBK7281231.1 DEAD/DEAH box helicase [Burkholderiales bacterium]MBK7313918.1 DEAD/DEAH box helicase [Burkholderiales bacterium]MBL0245065.1 DEAD/DEAH box helicase [Rhodoferax sp.]
MTDAFEVTGAFAPAESLSTTPTGHDAVDLSAMPIADEPEVPEAPNGFVTMGLAPELVHAVKDLGYTQPTPVQIKTIPLALPGESAGQQAGKYIDLMVSSQTGSGKTAAFLLPMLHTLLKQQAESEAAERAEFERLVAEAAAKGEAPPKRAKRKDPTNVRNFKAPAPGALIVCPTRELAQQVANDAIDLVQHCRGLRIANIVGGMPYQLQIAKLQNANLVVATPGRLLDLQRSMQIKLDQVQFLVVDEADRMLDLGFSDDLAEINQLTIARKQTMMFSATFAPRIQQLAARVMREPQRITIDSPTEKHANIKQVLFWADNAHHKRKLLDHWLRDTTINQAIVFASTQIECDGLANDLQQDGFDAVALHGALSQGLRNRRLMALRNGQVQILVATDVAARGIDVPTVTHVFNFGLPMKAEDYTHRIGRTGRAGRDGLAVTFAEVRDRRRIFDIEAHTRQHFKSETIPGLEPQQRFPDSRPGTGASFGGRGNHGAERAPRNFGGGDRKFGNGPREGGFGGGARTNQAPPREFGNQSRDFGGAAREGFSYERKGGFNDRFAGSRPDAAPRGGDFAARKPAFSKPMGVKPGNTGKVFVPRDAKKRAARTFD